MATPVVTPSGSLLEEKLKKSGPGKIGGIIFGVMLVCGLIYIGIKLASDLSIVHSASVFPFVPLGLALFIALGFEFVNGFHDTANAVATCIYTHSLEPHVAVVYSGIMNFTGVLMSTGAVAFSIITLLPVELILKVSKGFKALLRSPVVAFGMAALLFLLFKLLARDPRLYKAPEGTAPPPFYIRVLLILTCGGVSFAHGSNDGQKGMGLIMLILVGTVPTAYALNHAVGAHEVQTFA